MSIIKKKSKKYYKAVFCDGKKVFITEVNKSQIFCDGHTFKKWSDILKYLEDINGYYNIFAIERINCK